MKIYVRAAKRPGWMPNNVFTEEEYQYDKIRRKMLKEIDRIPGILANIADVSDEWYDMIGDIKNETNRNMILRIAESVLDVDDEIWEVDDLLGAQTTLRWIVKDVYNLFDKAKQYM